MRTHSAERRLFLRDIAMLIGVPLVALVGLIFWWQPWPDRFNVPPQSGTVFEQITGTWAWAGSDTCGVSHHTIHFDPQHAVMYVAHARPWTDEKGVRHDTTMYDIRASDSNHVTGFIRGETRTTPVGSLVVWDLVLTSPDSYQWKQAGFWGILGYTSPIRRCPSPDQWPFPAPK